MAESTQHILDRVRPPRVQITYDVEIGDAIEMKELPFVVGIMSDLSGKPEEPLPPMKERKFVEIDNDNFNDVRASINPRVACRVDNKLVDDDSKLGVVLNFKQMDDFHPSSIVEQVEPLRKLYEVRKRLVDLMAKLDGNDDLDKLLQDVVNNTQELEEIKNLAGSSSEDKSDEAEATVQPESGEPESPKPTEGQ